MYLLYPMFVNRCDQFVGFCDIQGTFYSRKTNSCCGAIFDPDPFFAFTGTCFKMKASIYETIPYVFHSINVWLLLGNENTPKFEIRFETAEKHRENVVTQISVSGGMVQMQCAGQAFPLG